jgi:hypothetical protein
LTGLYAYAETCFLDGCGQLWTVVWRTSVPPVMWYVVILGAVLNVLVLWLFDLTRTTHFILGGVLTLFIGVVIYMVAVLDQPFRGVHGLEPVDLLEVRQQMKP